MRRHLLLLDHALSTLLRRPGRSLALLVVFTFTVTALSSVLFLTSAMRREAAAVLEGAPDLVVQRLEAGRHAPSPASRAEALGDIAGVRAARPRLWGYYYDALTKANYTLIALDDTALDLPLLEGTPPGAGECMIGAGVAALLQLAAGGEIILVDHAGTGVAFTVSGVFHSASALLTNDLVVMTRPDLEAFFGQPPDLATDIAIAVPNARELTTVAAKVRRLFPDARVVSRRDMVSTYDAVFHWRGGMMLAVLSGALAAFAILAWDRAAGASAEERREVGLLKALGWDTADVLVMKGWEGAALSVTALLLGVLAGYANVFYLGAPLLAPVLKGWSVLFPPFRLTPAVDAGQLAALAVLTVVPYVVATVVPAWRLASIDPDEVLRG